VLEGTSSVFLLSRFDDGRLGSEQRVSVAVLNRRRQQFRLCLVSCNSLRPNGLRRWVVRPSATTSFLQHGNFIRFQISLQPDRFVVHIVTTGLLIQRPIILQPFHSPPRFLESSYSVKFDFN
jgi:hypothetical protein